MDLKGRLLGNRYEIIEKIGSGGMATVYKAKWHVLNRYVAIKILRDEFTTDDEFIKRFEVEAQSAASITHPNIVSVTKYLSHNAISGNSFSPKLPKSFKNLLWAIHLEYSIAPFSVLFLYFISVVI